MTTSGRPMTVAFLGTGTMGAPMARNLATAGFAVRAWNRTRERAAPLASAGVEVVDSPASAATGADVLITMLFDEAAVSAVAPEALAALPDGAIWVQMSTVGVDATRRLAALAAEHGTPFVDAPVVGTKAPAEQGTLVVLAAADPSLRPRCQPIFDVVGSRTVWVDAEAGGSKLKLVVNSWLVALTEALAEAIALAEASDLDPRLFLDTIKGGVTDTPYAQLKGAAMLERDFRPSFALKAATKDAGLAADYAKEVGLDLAVADAVHTHMTIAVERGHGDEDVAATYYAHTRG